MLQHLVALKLSAGVQGKRSPQLSLKSWEAEQQQKSGRQACGLLLQMGALGSWLATGCRYHWGLAHLLT